MTSLSKLESTLSTPLSKHGQTIAVVLLGTPELFFWRDTILTFLAPKGHSLKLFPNFPEIKAIGFGEKTCCGGYFDFIELHICERTCQTTVKQITKTAGRHTPCFTVTGKKTLVAREMQYSLMQSSICCEKLSPLSHH